MACFFGPPRRHRWSFNGILIGDFVFLQRPPRTINISERCRYIGWGLPAVHVDHPSVKLSWA